MHSRIAVVLKDYLTVLGRQRSFVERTAGCWHELTDF